MKKEVYFLENPNPEEEKTEGTEEEATAPAEPVNN